MEYDKLLKERNHYIAKQNDLIQRSRYEMTSQQQKVLLYFISKIKPEDTPDKLYTLTISDICQVCGFRTDGGYYFESIKQDLTAIDKVYAWIKTREGAEVRFRWFNVLYINPGSSAVSLSFHNSVQPYLFDLHEQYTQYSFVNILGLKSKYAIRLYEFVSSVDRKKAVILSLGEFKERMGIPNDGTYAEIHHVRQRILQPAVKEINEMTNFSVSYSLIKSGRSYSEIEFFVDSKTDFQQIITNHRVSKKLTK